MSDTITLPRGIGEYLMWVLEESPHHGDWSWNDCVALDALRTALAAEPTKQEPVAWLSRDEARLALWKAINSREFGNPTDDKLILDHLRQQGLWIGKVTSPVPPEDEALRRDAELGRWLRDWLDNNGLLVRAIRGESLAGYEHPDIKALRRDAERLWEALKHYGKHDDDCGDHDAYNSESLRHCGCGLDAVLDETLGEKR